MRWLWLQLLSQDRSWAAHHKRSRKGLQNMIQTIWWFKLISKLINTFFQCRTPCPICGKKYSDLRQHIRLVHEGHKVNTKPSFFVPLQFFALVGVPRVWKKVHKPQSTSQQDASQGRISCSVLLILRILSISEAACDVRPMWKELLPAEPIKASHPRCALLQEAQRITTLY